MRGKTFLVYVLGGFLIFVGLIYLFESFITGVVFIAWGALLIYKKKKKATVSHPTATSKAPTSISTSDSFLKKDASPQKAAISFHVAGVTKSNDAGANIQNIIKEIVEGNAFEEPYDGLSAKDIKELLEGTDDKLFMYDAVYLSSGLSLVPEPTNKYDPNAIKVISSDYGHLGYVPKDLTGAVLKHIGGKIDVEVVGGKYKYYDDEEEKVRSDSFTYGLVVNLTPEN